MKKELIYLVAPYSYPDKIIRQNSHPNKITKQKRYEDIVKLTNKLIAEGKLIFPPIIYSYTLSQEFKNFKEWDDYWQEFCKQMLPACDQLYILCM